ncbi:acyl-CoA N-acyltransferase [Dipodascopsis uninucleata]
MRSVCKRSDYLQWTVPGNGNLTTWQPWKDCQKTNNRQKITLFSDVNSPKPAPGTVIYIRYVPSMAKTFKVRILDTERDGPKLAEWMNIDRVALFWNMRGDFEKVHRPYLEKLTNNPYATAIIGSYDDEDFLYSELYSVPEDHLAPHVKGLDPNDVGFHLLVGKAPSLRGPHVVPTWLTSLTHLLLLCRPIAKNVYLEPKASNIKLIDYLISSGYTKLYEFDFPHKHAALMRITREEFLELGLAL